MAFGDTLQQIGAGVGAVAPVAGLALGVAGGISKLFGGKSDYEKAKEELDRMKDPFYKIQDEYFQNRNIAGSEAQYGFSPQEQDYYTTESQRGLGGSLNASTSTGGSPNYISEIFDVYNRGIRGTAAQGAQLRQQKLKEFYDRNSTLAGQKTIQWHLNEYQPNQNKRALLSGNMQAAKQNQSNGWDDILGSISAAGTAFGNSGMLGGGQNGGGTSSYSDMSASAVNPQPSFATPQAPTGRPPQQISSYLTNPSYAAASSANPQPSYSPPNWGYIPQ